MRWWKVLWVGGIGLAQTWQDVGGGANFAVNTLLSWGGSLYVGGSFTAVGGANLQAEGIARWTGTAWQAIANPGAGGNGRINAMTVFQGKLIVGGDFTGIGGTSASNIAAYDPATGTWSSVGGGVNGEVHALYVYDGELLVGGSFTRVGSSQQAIHFFARWDGTTWKAPDPSNPSYLLVGGNPLAFAEYNGKLYVGGNFVAAYYNQTDKAYLAIWDKATQQLIPAYSAGQGPDHNVWALAVWNGKLYIGGEFSTIGGVSSPKLAALNGTTYEAVAGSPTSGRVQALIPTPSHLYVAGNFTSAGGQTVNRVARLSTAGTWSALASGLGPTIVNTLAIHNGFLYAGGNFTQDGAGNPLSRIAVYSQSLSSLTAPAPSAPLLHYSSPYLTLESEEAFQGVLVISNSLGQVVYEQALSLSPFLPISIDLSPLAEGMYVVRITSGEKTIRSTKIFIFP